jgi:hypothetical protein
MTRIGNGGNIAKVLLVAGVKIALLRSLILVRDDLFYKDCAPMELDCHA